MVFALISELCMVRNKINSALLFLFSGLLVDNPEQQVRQTREHPPHRHLLGQAVSQLATHGGPLQAPLQKHSLLW